jgi:hypothetical protein
MRLTWLEIAVLLVLSLMDIIFVRKCRMGGILSASSLTLSASSSLLCGACVAVGTPLIPSMLVAFSVPKLAWVGYELWRVQRLLKAWSKRLSKSEVKITCE